MAMLNYWVAESDDNQAYNIRAKTKKEVLRLLEVHGCRPDGKPIKRGQWSVSFGPPHKVEVYYRDAFDLLNRCLSEGRVYEGEQ